MKLTKIMTMSATFLAILTMPAMNASAYGTGYIATYYYASPALRTNIGVKVTYCNGQHIISSGYTSSYTRKQSSC